MADLWLTIDEVADVLYGAGFVGEPLAIAIAVSKGEAGQGAPAGYWSNAAAIGDTALVDETYGPSIGFMQIRSVNAERGKGSDRDALALAASPAHQATAAYNIVGGNVVTGSSRPNRGWGHWTIWKNRDHEPYLAEATAAAQRREEAGGAGSISANGTIASGELSPDVTRVVPNFPTAYRAPRRNADLVLAAGVGGAKGERRIGDRVLDGRVELTIAMASELTVTLADPRYELIGLAYGINVPAELGALLHWSGLNFTIAAHDQGPGPGPDDPRVTLIGRSVGVERLKQTNMSAGGTVQGVKPLGYDVTGKLLSFTEYAELQATKWAGLSFVGQGSSRVSDIAPVLREDGIYESPWEVIHRGADELGFWVYVTEGRLHFGRPSWLLARAQEVRVGYRGSWGDTSLDAIELPQRRASLDTFAGATLTFKLPRWRGELVRPGMKASVKLHPQAETTYWLIETVAWELDDGVTPVDVTCVEAIDPPIKAAQGVPGGGPTASTATGLPYDPGDGNLDPDGDGRTPRITFAEREQLFGHHGDESRWKRWETPWGIVAVVHDLVLAHFQVACFRAFDASTWTPQRIDSAVDRPIDGTNEWSLHSWALAWDIFDTPPGVPPPGGVRGALNAPDAAFQQAFASAGFYLGSKFSNPDHPHIEWANVPPIVAS